MLSFEEYIYQLNEGLIKTNPIDKSLTILKKSLINNIEYWYDLEINNNNNTFQINFEGVLNENELEWLFRICNNLGYFCSFYFLKKHKFPYRGFSWSNIEDFNGKVKNCIHSGFLFESKFDTLLKYKPSFVYHVSDEKYLDRIKKHGVIPKTKNKKTNHPERIYITLSLNKAEKLIDTFKSQDKIKNIKNEYLIFKIDLTDKYYDNIKIFKDPNMDGGFYLYDNIKPNDIIKL
jgi:hypothetical protein